MRILRTLTAVDLYWQLAHGLRRHDRVPGANITPANRRAAARSAPAL
jgi:hypothetical protein